MDFTDFMLAGAWESSRMCLC